MLKRLKINGSSIALILLTFRKRDTSMIVLDTVFVRKSHRGNGDTKSLINQLLNAPNFLLSQTRVDHSENELLSRFGLSSPISNGMFCLLIRMIAKDSKYFSDVQNVTVPLKERIWLVDEVNGDCINVWWSVMKIARERSIDLRSVLAN